MNKRLIKHQFLLISLFLFSCSDEIESIGEDQNSFNCENHEGIISNEDFFITTESEVMDFLQSPIKEITGKLVIRDLEDLSFLKCVEKVNVLKISNCNVTNLKGLENLREANEIHIESMQQLEKLEGLSSIQKIGYLEVAYNSLLPNLIGLESLQALGSMLLERNNNLESIIGLENVTENFFFIPDTDYLTTFTYWRIENNPKLKSISALNGVSGQVHAGIRINECPMLTDLGRFDSVNKAIGGLLITHCPSLPKVDCFPNAKEMGFVIVESSSQVSSISFPSTEKTSYIGVGWNDNLVEIDFNSLQEISGGGNGDWSIKIDRNPSLSSLDGFINLEYVERNIEVNQWISPNPMVNLCSFRKLISSGQYDFFNNSMSLNTACWSSGFGSVNLGNFDMNCECN